MIHILFLTLFATGAALAQESGFERSMEPESEQDLNLNSNKNAGANPVPESQQFQQADIQKPQEQTFDRDRKTSADEPDEEQSDDDLISFNFLYYIIQKYKMSDIVD